MNTTGGDCQGRGKRCHSRTCCLWPGYGGPAPDGARIPLNHGAQLPHLPPHLGIHLGWAGDAWPSVEEGSSTKNETRHRKRAFSGQSGARRATLAHPHHTKLKDRSPYIMSVLGNHSGQAGGEQSVRELHTSAGRENVTLSRSGPAWALRSAERFENQEQCFLHHNKYARRFPRRSVAWRCTGTAERAFFTKKR